MRWTDDCTRLHVLSMSTYDVYGHRLSPIHGVAGPAGMRIRILCPVLIFETFLFGPALALRGAVHLCIQRELL